MRRARWWIIGLVFLMLAFGFVVFMLSTATPFAFLSAAPAEHVWIRTGFGPDTAVRTYRIDRPLNHVVESARAELEPKGWKRYDYSGDVIFSPHQDLDRQLVESVSISESSGVAGVRVDVARSARLQDHIGLWLWQRNNGNPSGAPLQGSPPAGQP